MGMFDDIGSAQSSQGGAYLLAGQHLFEIKALKQPPKLRAGDCFIAELKVVESTNPNHEVGQSVSWVRNVTKHKEMALGDIKAFLAAVAGIPEEAVDKKGAELAVSEAQPFAGRFIRCEAWNVKTDAGNDFTKTRWTTP